MPNLLPRGRALGPVRAVCLPPVDVLGRAGFGAWGRRGRGRCSGPGRARDGGQPWGDLRRRLPRCPGGLRAEEGTLEEGADAEGVGREGSLRSSGARKGRLSQKLRTVHHVICEHILFTWNAIVDPFLTEDCLELHLSFF